MPKFLTFFESPFQSEEYNDDNEDGDSESLATTVSYRSKTIILAHHGTGVRLKWLSYISYAENLVWLGE